MLDLCEYFIFSQVKVINEPNSLLTSQIIFLKLTNKHPYFTKNSRSLYQNISSNQPYHMHTNSSTIPVSPTAKPLITELNRESLMSMMKQIMEKSFPFTDELHCVVEESNQCSESMIISEVNQQVEFEEEMREVWRRAEGQKGAAEVGQNVNEFSRQNLTPENDRINSLPRKINISTSLPCASQFPSISMTPIDSSLSSSSSQFDKLIEITSRCVEYYNTFLRQKSFQFQTIQKTFSEMTSSLDLTFGEIINEAERKQKELKEFLGKKYKEILEYRNEQDQGLKATLEDIHSVHLANLMKNGRQCKTQTQFKDNNNNQLLQQINKTSQLPQKGPDNHNQILTESTESPDSSQLSLELHNYAFTLNQFYVQIQQIEKCSFKEMVEQSVGFINNLISEEIKILMTQKIPSRLSQKNIIRQNSKDFLSEQSRNQQLIKQQNFGLLDFESFTKLFWESSKLNAEDDQKNEGTKAIEEVLALFDSKNNYQKFSLNQKSQEKIETRAVSKQLKELNQKQKAIENKQMTKKTVNLKHHYSIQGQQNNSHSRSQKQKTSFIKKQTHCQGVSPSPKKFQNDHPHKQNSLQLIKKISNQQNNRSAKIKGYMVSFQDSSKKQVQDEKVSSRKQLKSKPLNSSKSPQKKSTTPTKLSKSGQKKVVTLSNAVHNSSQVKLRILQQSSLKSSRTSGYVSEFKIGSSRRQSVMLK